MKYIRRQRGGHRHTYVRRQRGGVYIKKRQRSRGIGAGVLAMALPPSILGELSKVVNVKEKF